MSSFSMTDRSLMQIRKASIPNVRNGWKAGIPVSVIPAKAGIPLPYLQPNRA